VVICNRLGLHARASAAFSALASRFSCDVFLGVDEAHQVNGKSIMGVMMLAASQGTHLWLQVDGADEEAALEALSALIARRFDEAE